MERYILDHPEPTEDERAYVKQQLNDALRELLPLDKETERALNRFGVKYGIRKLRYYRLRDPAEDEAAPVQEQA